MYTLNNAKFHKLQEPSGEHFSLPRHTFHQLQGLAIEQVKNKDPFILKAREACLIKRFDCHRKGFNKEPQTSSLASSGSF